mmetsp:Transcript_14903/g.19503  ORF Transcript_14903/g.19503 Transcript_14903/m.19503 type:complete len:322 (-) Transcript_14903:106-1071(-)
MITFIGFQSKLFQRLEIFRLEFIHFPSEDGFWRSGTINTRCFHGNHSMATILQEVMRIQRHNTSLIGLGHIRKDGVNHTNQHSVLQRVSSIFNNGDNVGTLFGHGQQIAPWAMTEFHSIHGTSGTDNIGYVTHTRTGSGTNVQYLAPRTNPNVINTTQNSGGNFRSKGIPHAIFNFLCNCFTSRRWYFDRNTLFPIDSKTRCTVERDQGIFLASSNKNTFVTMRFNQDLGATRHASTTATTSIATTTASTTASITTASSTKTATTATWRSTSKSSSSAATTATWRSTSKSSSAASAAIATYSSTHFIGVCVCIYIIDVVCW